jgi:hypothetical protein
MGSGIQIRIVNADLDPRGGKLAQKEEKVNLKTRKKLQKCIFSAIIF